MRNWIAIVLLLLVGTAGAENDTPATLIHIGPEDFTTQTLGMKTVEGHAYLIVQAEARNGQIANTLGYCRIRAWYDMRDRVTRKVLLLDHDDAILTTIRFSAFSLTNGKPRAGQMEVTDHSTGQTTVFQLDGSLNPLNPLTLI
jgi:hypothetical protein